MDLLLDVISAFSDVGRKETYNKSFGIQKKPHASNMECFYQSFMHNIICDHHHHTTNQSTTHSFAIRYIMKASRVLLCCLLCGAIQAFQVGRKSESSPKSMAWARLASEKDEDINQMSQTMEKDQENSKFGFFQRIESVKCVVVGAVTGSIALGPFALLHDFLLVPSMIDMNGLPQLEFDTDAAALQSGLFAIVYRYCIRTDTNPQLQDGVVGAFAITRTLSRIVVPPYCTAIPLYCKFGMIESLFVRFKNNIVPLSCLLQQLYKGGPPLGYLDWSLLGQLAVNGAESMAMFTATATAINYCMERKIISKFE